MTQEVSTSIWEIISVIQELASEISASLTDQDEITAIVLYRLLNQCA